MISLTIVVPAYNVEPYLAKCLESIINQDIGEHNLEIIVIDDGSNDCTLEIANAYATKVPFLQVFTQENQGLSSARNKGLLLAKCKYVWFIDSDDWIQPNSIQSVLSLCEQYLPDVLSIGRLSVKGDQRTTIINNSKFQRKLISGETCIQEDLFEIPAQLYIFKRSYLKDKNLRFAVGKLHEDKEFTPRAIFLASTFFYSCINIYCHLQRPGSITQVPNPKRCYDLMEISEKTVEFARMTPMSRSSKTVFFRHAFFSLTLAAILAYKLKDKLVKRAIFNQLNSYKNTLFEVFKNDKPIYKIESVVFMCSPKAFALLLLAKMRSN